jgi:peptide deformylase
MQFSLEHTPVLRSSSTEWDFTTDKDAEKLESEMIAFMLAENGIGLAANQIGISKRVFVMGHLENPVFPKPFALFNPEILESSEEEVLDQEGCLSFPGIWLTVKRPAWVKVRYFDSSGTEHIEKYEGYVSKCFQHELDHLNGVCFVDKVSKLKLQLALKKQRKSIK